MLASFISIFVVCRKQSELKPLVANEIDAGAPGSARPSGWHRHHVSGDRAGVNANTCS